MDSAERKHVHTKVWFDRIWMVWGKEPSRESHVIDKSWLKQIEPPFYIGTGISIRIGIRSIRIGLCKAQLDPDPTEVEDFEMEVMLSGGRPLGELHEESTMTKVFLPGITKERLMWDSSGQAQTREQSASSPKATPLRPMPPSLDQPNESVGSPFLSPSTLPSRRA